MTENNQLAENIICDNYHNLSKQLGAEFSHGKPGGLKSIPMEQIDAQEHDGHIKPKGKQAAEDKGKKFSEQGGSAFCFALKNPDAVGDIGK